MKIKEISIKDYKGIGDVTINPERINMLTGECGSGKSSVLDAIRFALGGKADRSDINSNAKEAMVTVVFEDESSISRTRKEDGIVCKCNGKAASAKAVNEFLKSRCGIDASLFDAMSSVDYFKELSKKDLTELFLSILPVQINFDAMVKLIEQKNGKPLTDKEKEYLQNRFPKMPAQFGLDAIDKAQKEVYGQRAKVNANLKAVTARCAFDEQSLPDETKEQLEKKLYEIAKKESEFNNHAKLITNYNKAVKARNDAQKRMDSLKKSAETYKDVNKPDSAVLEKAKNDREQFQKAINQANQMIATLKSNIELFNRTLENLDKPVCPISEKLICTTDKSGIKNELIALIGDNSTALKQQNDFVKRCQEQIVLRDSRIESYQKNVISYNQKVTILKQINEFVFPELPERPADLKAVDFAQQKSDINKKMSILAQYEMVKKYKKEQLDLQSASALCETAMQILDVKQGVRSLILKQALTPFERLCNQKASVLRKGFQIKIECEDGIEFSVKPYDGDGVKYIPMNMVSTGEFVFVGYLLMSVIQAVTGSKYLVIDNLDRLDKQSFAALIKLIDGDRAYEHVFLGTVNHKDLEEAAQKSSQALIKISMN